MNKIIKYFIEILKENHEILLLKLFKVEIESKTEQNEQI